MSTETERRLATAKRLIEVGEALAKHYNQRETMVERLGDGWFNEAGAKRARYNIDRLETCIQHCIDEMEDIIKDRP
jgi:hypothetical protein